MKEEGKGDWRARGEKVERGGDRNAGNNEDDGEGAR